LSHTIAVETHKVQAECNQLERAQVTSKSREAEREAQRRQAAGGSGFDWVNQGLGVPRCPNQNIPMPAPMPTAFGTRLVVISGAPDPE
jgi:hypothetical protein